MPLRARAGTDSDSGGTRFLAERGARVDFCQAWAAIDTKQLFARRNSLPTFDEQAVYYAIGSSDKLAAFAFAIDPADSGCDKRRIGFGRATLRNTASGERQQRKEGDEVLHQLLNTVSGP
jgi:hypothetical protein